MDYLPKTQPNKNTSGRTTLYLTTAMTERKITRLRLTVVSNMQVKLRLTMLCSMVLKVLYAGKYKAVEVSNAE